MFTMAATGAGVVPLKVLGLTKRFGSRIAARGQAAGDVGLPRDALVARGVADLRF
jgi:hypothetical protein